MTPDRRAERGRPPPAARDRSRSAAARRGARSLGGEQVEGRQAVRELLVAGRRPVRELFVVEGRDPSPVLEEILDLASAKRVPVRRVRLEELDRLATSAAPQGVLARTNAVEVAALDDLIATGRDRPPFLVALDGVTDPQNLGSVLRSALAAGATGVLLPAHGAARLTASVAKAAAGALEHLPISLVPGIPSALERLGRAGIWRVGLDAAGTTALDDVAVLEEPVALVLGAEGAGLSALSRRRCDAVARIEMHGPLDSLSVSAAAAVACFTVARRRAVRPVD